eukprot:ctg_110.g51
MAGDGRAVGVADAAGARQPAALGAPMRLRAAGWVSPVSSCDDRAPRLGHYIRRQRIGAGQYAEVERLFVQRLAPLAAAVLRRYFGCDLERHPGDRLQHPSRPRLRRRGQGVRATGQRGVVDAAVAGGVAAQWRHVLGAQACRAAIPSIHRGARRQRDAARCAGKRHPGHRVAHRAGRASGCQRRATVNAATGRRSGIP